MSATRHMITLEPKDLAIIEEISGRHGIVGKSGVIRYVLRHYGLPGETSKPVIDGQQHVAVFSPDPGGIPGLYRGKDFFEGGAAQGRDCLGPGERWLDEFAKEIGAAYLTVRAAASKKRGLKLINDKAAVTAEFVEYALEQKDNPHWT